MGERENQGPQKMFRFTENGLARSWEWNDLCQG